MTGQNLFCSKISFIQNLYCLKSKATTKLLILYALKLHLNAVPDPFGTLCINKNAQVSKYVRDKNKEIGIKSSHNVQ